MLPKRVDVAANRVVLSAGRWTSRQIIDWGVIEPVMITPLRGGSGCTLGPVCSLPTACECQHVCGSITTDWGFIATHTEQFDGAASRLQVFKFRIPKKSSAYRLSEGNVSNSHTTLDVRLYPAFQQRACPASSSAAVKQKGQMSASQSSILVLDVR